MSKYLLTIFCLLYINSVCLAADLPPELIARKGLPNFLKKLGKGNKDMTIAYLGGSITEAENGWRNKSFDWFNKQYSAGTAKNKGNIRHINAAIGGTTSEFGVYRFNEHVLQYKPDLLFIEFAVNDDASPRETILRSMEGIIRKTWAADPETDICIVYTFARYLYAGYDKGETPATVKTMEELAEYYGIPSINFSPRIADLIKNKKLFMTGKSPVVNDSTFFSSDGVHPFRETGHVLYAESVISSINALEKTGKPARHALGKSYFSDKMANAKMAEVTRGMMNAAFDTMSLAGIEDFKWISRYLPSVHKMKAAGQELSFCFTGESIGFMDIMGPEATKLEVLIDNDTPRIINRFDEYCQYIRCSFFVIDGLKNGRHTIRIKRSSEKPDKFKILGRKRETLDNPERFNVNEWWIGKILLNGEICKEKK